MRSFASFTAHGSSRKEALRTSLGFHHGGVACCSLRAVARIKSIDFHDGMRRFLSCSNFRNEFIQITCVAEVSKKDCSALDLYVPVETSQTSF